jgi:DNA helicase-2/ATP-dependent DNA helicase PcrA
LNFKRDFPGAEVIVLEQNYRSTQNILSAANAVIGNNFNRSPKKLWTENEKGPKICIFKAYNEGEEGAFVVKTVRRGIDEEGARYNDFAVLYRTNAQSRALEDSFVMAGIPYRLYGGVRFYERAEVKDLLSYLKALHNPSDDLAWQRIVNVPRRGIGATTVARVLAYAYEQDMPFSKALGEAFQIPGLKSKAKDLKKFVDFMDECGDFAEEHSVSELLQKIIDETQFLESLADGTIEGEGRVENAKELLSKALGSDDLGVFLEEVALVADVDNYQEDADTVVLMTLHSAKGLEFNRVFITGFEENLFPASRSALSGNPDELEEERRLCYVGFTRARARLYITHTVSRMLYGQTISNAPSRFLKEIPEDLIEAPIRQKVPAKPSTLSRPGKAIPDTKEKKTVRAVNPYLQNLPAPKNLTLDFDVGDRVAQAKYGEGEIIAIRPAGADYEVTIMFENAGQKKFMAHLSKLVKVCT